MRVTRHHSCRVSPFGHPRIHARLTAPRGITQPPTSFIGSQCQGIHHAPLNTYNTKPKAKKIEIAHQHTKTPTPQREPAPMRARCSQPLSTNQTPHPTTKDRGNNNHTPTTGSGPHTLGSTTSGFPHSGRRDDGLVVSKPNSVSDDFPGQCFPTGSTFVVHQTPTHYRSGAIHRFAHGHSDPRYAGRPGSRGAP